MYFKLHTAKIYIIHGISVFLAQWYNFYYDINYNKIIYTMLKLYTLGTLYPILKTLILSVIVHIYIRYILIISVKLIKPFFL